tara:strand:- start:334 stop:750 length:417 start_codon:yes stop_codon:yes gene_type:complete
LHIQHDILGSIARSVKPLVVLDIQVKDNNDDRACHAVHVDACDEGGYFLLVKFVDGHHEAKVKRKHGCPKLKDACVVHVPIPFAIQSADNGVLTQNAPHKHEQVDGEAQQHQMHGGGKGTLGQEIVRNDERLKPEHGA